MYVGIFELFLVEFPILFAFPDIPGLLNSLA
jgi:hypothetical protein